MSSSGDTFFLNHILEAMKILCLTNWRWIAPRYKPKSFVILKKRKTFPGWHHSQKSALHSVDYFWSTLSKKYNCSHWSAGSLTFTTSTTITFYGRLCHLLLIPTEVPDQFFWKFLKRSKRRDSIIILVICMPSVKGQQSPIVGIAVTYRIIGIVTKDSWMRTSSLLKKSCC